jgi:hypothetical protein
MRLVVEGREIARRHWSAVCLIFARGPMCPGLPQGTKPSSPYLAPSTATNPGSPHLGTDEEVLGLAAGAVLLVLGADIVMCVCDVCVCGSARDKVFDGLVCCAKMKERDGVEVRRNGRGEVEEFWSLMGLECSTFTNTLASLTSSLRFHILPIFY